MSREQKERRTFFFFPRVCLAGRGLWLKRVSGGWFWFGEFQDKGGAVFGLESGSLLFLALPLQWRGPVNFFSSSIGFPKIWTRNLVALHVLSAGPVLVFDGPFLSAMKIWAAKL